MRQAKFWTVCNIFIFVCLTVPFIKACFLSTLLLEFKITGITSKLQKINGNPFPSKDLFLEDEVRGKLIPKSLFYHVSGFKVPMK